MRFTYDSDWLVTAEAPISLSLPLAARPRQRLAAPWRDDPILDAIDETVAGMAESLRRAADEPA